MGRKANPNPPLRPHSSGQWYITLDGQKKYLGTDQEAAEKKRRRLLAERLLADPDTPTAPVVQPGRLSVSEVVLACTSYSRSYYDQSHWSRVDQALVAVATLHGTEYADQFDSVKLARVRDWLLTRPHQRKPGLKLSRNYVNRMVGVIQTLWTWAATRGLVPEARAAGLQLVKAVREGKGGRETPAVVSVSPVIVAQTLPRLGPIPRAMVQLQQLTGMRPGEVCGMLRSELSLSPSEKIRTIKGLEVSAIVVEGTTVWVYAPGKHKTRCKGKSRIVAIGPQAQEILRPFLDRDTDEYLFSPAEAVRHHSGQRAPGNRYTTASYGHAIRKACVGQEPRERKRGRTALPGRPAIPHWHPHQLRHGAATTVSDEFDEAHAQAALGHSNASMTRAYIDSQLKKAATVAAHMG